MFLKSEACLFLLARLKPNWYCHTSSLGATSKQDTFRIMYALWIFICFLYLLSIWTIVNRYFWGNSHICFKCLSWLFTLLELQPAVWRGGCRSRSVSWQSWPWSCLWVAVAFVADLVVVPWGCCYVSEIMCLMCHCILEKKLLFYAYGCFACVYVQSHHPILGRLLVCSLVVGFCLFFFFLLRLGLSVCP